MISDELLNKFDSIEDLPVSEEMLGAYMEGNLHGSEFREIQNYIHDYESLSNLMDVVQDDIDIVNGLDDSLSKGDALWTENGDIPVDFVLPEVDSLSALSLIDVSSPLTEDTTIGADCRNFIDEERHNHHSEDNNGHNLNHHDPELDFGMTSDIE